VLHADEPEQALAVQPVKLAVPLAHHDRQGLLMMQPPTLHIVVLAPEQAQAVPCAQPPQTPPEQAPLYEQGWVIS